MMKSEINNNSKKEKEERSGEESQIQLNLTRKKKNIQISSTILQCE